MLFQSFFDPGHGLLSSFDERAVAVVAFLVLSAVGLLAEALWDAKGMLVAGALVVFVVAIVVWAPPLFAEEWHYAVLAAVPVVLGNHFYRGRNPRGRGGP
ncbi:hypothetical protein [Halomarina rubra]|uniref:SPW repeat-containing protein n=1 Tax=Halomarina rubra TaxID=2071873 RepID=A0ABD6B119_9EURY|nr:hypothetical protein [Halomarina rubra]